MTLKIGDLIPIGGSGNAKKSDVFEGRTFSSNDGTDLIGTMPNMGSKTFTPMKSTQTSSSGYYDRVTVNPIPNNYYGIKDYVPYKNIIITPEVRQFKGDYSSVYSLIIDKNKYIYFYSGKDTIKMSPEGYVLWRYTHKYKDYYTESITVDNNGYVYSCINDISHANLGIVKKISPDGKEVWEFRGFNHRMDSLVVDNNGYVYAIGYVSLKKISPDGEEMWDRSSFSQSLNSINIDSNNNLYVGGEANLRKISSDGSTIWENTDYAKVYSIAVDGNNLYISKSGCMAKMSLDGKEVWKIGNGMNSLIVDNDKYIYGTNYNKIIKMSPEGKEIWSYIYPGDGSATSMTIDNNGYIYSGDNEGVIRKIFDGIKIIG